MKTMAFQVQRLSRVLHLFGVMVGPGRCYQRDRAADATTTNSNNVVQFVDHDGARDDDAATTENTFDRSSKYNSVAARAGPSSDSFKADAEVDTTDLRGLFLSSSTSSATGSAPDSQMLRRGAGGSRPRNSGRSTTKPKAPSRTRRGGRQVERNPHQPLSSASARLLAEHASSNPENLCLRWAGNYTCLPTQCRRDDHMCASYQSVEGSHALVWGRASCNAANCCQEGGACSSFTCPGPEWTDGSNSTSPTCCNEANCTNEECCDRVTSAGTPGAKTTATSTTTAGSGAAAAVSSLRTTTWWLLAMAGIASALLT